MRNLAFYLFYSNEKSYSINSNLYSLFSFRGYQKFNAIFKYLRLYFNYNKSNFEIIKQMGIQGLLPFAHEAVEITHISKLSGKKAAVDGFVWLHRGCISCAREIGKGEKTAKYIDYFMRQIRLLTDNRITPVIVFDGGDLPAKKITNDKRKAERRENIKKAIELEEMGMISESYDYYIRSIEISQDLLVPLFEKLRQKNIEFIVAPYEADAELAYLAYNRFVDMVITEDSDLLVYQCPLSVFKLDKDGNCNVIRRERLLRLLSSCSLNQKQFVEVCVLAGCDYLPSVPRMGIRTAVKRMNLFGNGESVIAGLRADPKWDVPEDYEKKFQEACTIFTTQRVFDPRTKTTVGIFDECQSEIAGPLLSQYEAINIAMGLMNAKTKELFNPNQSVDPSISLPVYNTPISDSASSKFKPVRSTSLDPTASSPDVDFSDASNFIRVVKPKNLPPSLKRRNASYSESNPRLFTNK